MTQATRRQFMCLLGALIPGLSSAASAGGKLDQRHTVTSNSKVPADELHIVNGWVVTSTDLQNTLSRPITTHDS